jgi:hypothetical protein
MYDLSMSDLSQYAVYSKKRKSANFYFEKNFKH